MFKETTWKDSEKKVQDYMRLLGYKIISTNFSCVGVELDIVAILPKRVQKARLKQEYLERMKEDKTRKAIYKHSLKSSLKLVEDLLIITEVKGRETDKYGLGSEAVSDYKRQNMIRGARFLQKDKKFSNIQIRFDVASVDGGKIIYTEDVF